MSMDDPGWGGFTPLPPDGTTPPAGPGGGAPRARQPLLIGSVAVAVVALIAVAVALALQGGGGGGSKVAVATTSPTTLTTTIPTTVAPTTTLTGGSLPDAASAYLALESPAYNSLTAFGAVVSGWRSSPPSAAQAQTAANPAAHAFQTFNAQLLARAWPVVVQSKVDTLASQVEVVANDLGGIGLAFTTGTRPAWATQFTTDGDALITDADAVRATLNLPALATG